MVRDGTYLVGTCAMISENVTIGIYGHMMQSKERLIADKMDNFFKEKTK